MTQLTTQQADAIYGQTVTSNDGDKLGTIEAVYVDGTTGAPSWASIRTGHFGHHETLVPLTGATVADGGLTVPYTKDQVKHAPHQDPDTELSPSDEDALYAHYGIAATPAADTAPQATAPAATGPMATVGDDSVTRSEERLRVGTQTVETGRARLRKYVVTENVTQTVPVSHEEVRVVREPIDPDDGGVPATGTRISEQEVEVTLHAERPVVAKETVPVERVRLSTETVRGTETVDDTVRKEQIDITDGAVQGVDR